MIKILFIHHGNSIGGALINLVQLCNFLDKSKYSINVLVLKGDESVCEFLKENNIQYSIPKSTFITKRYRFFIHSMASNRNTYNLFRQVLYSLSWLAIRFYYARKELVRFSPDIVQLNSVFLTDWLKPASRIAKVVVHVQEPMHSGTIGLRSSFFALQIKLYADHVIAISEDNLKRIKQNIRAKSSVVYNNIDDRINNYKENSVVSGKVLYLGGSMTIKGFYTLVDALQFLDKDIIVHFLGPFEDESTSKSENYKQAISKIRNSSSAKLVGFSNNVLNEIASCEFLVSPFKKTHFSRPIIEAYSLKKTVVATRISGIEEMVKDKITGILVENDNPFALAQAINDLHKNRIERERLGDNARFFYENNFTPENFHRIEIIYSGLIKSDVGGNAAI